MGQGVRSLDPQKTTANEFENGGETWRYFNQGVWSLGCEYLHVFGFLSIACPETLEGMDEFCFRPLGCKIRELGLQKADF